jgi:hypothetical protein
LTGHSSLRVYAVNRNLEPRELERIRLRLEDWSARPGLLVVTSDQQEARRQDRHRQAQEAWEEEAASHVERVTEGRVRPGERLLAALQRLAGRG